MSVAFKGALLSAAILTAACDQAGREPGVPASPALASTAPSPSPAGNDRLDPERLGPSFAKALNGGKLDDAVARYASDAVLMAPSGVILKGKPSIERYWRTLATQGLRAVTLQSARTSAQDGVGYETGTFEWRSTGATGALQVEAGQFVSVLKHGEDGAWRVVYDVFTNLPQAAPALTPPGARPSPAAP